MFSSRSSGPKKRSSSSGKSFFSRKKEKPASSSKAPRDGGQKSRFVKPPNDPGSKNRDQGTDNYDNAVDYSEDSYQEAPQNSGGGGCLGSITGTIKFIAFLVFVVIIVVFVKCAC